MFNAGTKLRPPTGFAAFLLVCSCHAARAECPQPEADKTEEDRRRDAVGREARSFKLALETVRP